MGYNDVMQQEIIFFLLFSEYETIRSHNCQYIGLLLISTPIWIGIRDLAEIDLQLS